MLTHIRKPFSPNKLRYFVTKQNEYRRQILSSTTSHEYFNAIDKAHEILEGEKDLAKNVPSCVVIGMQSIGKSRMHDHINEKLPDLNTMLEDELRRCKVELEKLGRHPYPLESIALRDLQCIEESIDKGYEAFQPDLRCFTDDMAQKLLEIDMEQLGIVDTEKNLGKWLNTQRQDKKRGTLDTVKEKQLEDIGIVWDVFEYEWDIYTSKKGDTAGHMVGSSFERPIGKNDEHDTIRTYRNFKNQWLEETGHSWPSKCSTKGCSNEPTVGAHVFINKKEYAYIVPMCHQCNMDRNNYVPNEMFDDNLGFPIQLDDGTPCVELTHLHVSEQNKYAKIVSPTWLEMLERFIVYTKDQNYHSVPNKYKNDPQLGQWVSNQRRRYKGDGLNPRQIELLESNGIVWDVFESEWDENIKLPMEYKDREGHCQIPYSHKEDGVTLGSWLSSHRKDKKRGTLDTVKEKQLEELGIVWDVFESKWNENIKLLMEYKDREGHCNVPQDHKEDGKNLGEWLNSQRKDETRKFYIGREQKIEDALREISQL